MPDEPQSLGGRLALFEIQALTAQQRKVYDQIDKHMVPWAEKAGFKAKLADGRLVGPFNTILLSPNMAEAFLTLQAVEGRTSSLSPRVRQVVILTVGAVWKCDYERYAHSAVAREAGLSASAVGALAQGEATDDLSREEHVARRFTVALTTWHQVDDALFEEARGVFADRGIVDIVILAGCYDLICALLNAFKVPVPSRTREARNESSQNQRDVIARVHGGVLSHNKAPQALLTTVAEFPKGYFLENLAVREDNSVLVTAMNHKELWYVPPTSGGGQVEPFRLYTFEQPTTGLAEIEPDVFLMLAGNLYTTHESFIYRIDLREWNAGDPIKPELFCSFPSEARGLNGCCLLKTGVLLVADCFASLIWRIDFAKAGQAPRISVWAKHDSMGYYPGKMKPEQPGVNGIRYAAKTNQLYYTATAKKLFMRMAVDPDTLQPVGEPEIVVAGRMGDDFCIDEEGGVIYLATHRQNTIDVVSMEPALNSGFTQSVAGDPFTEALIGPSGGAWGRKPGEQGRTAYFIMDGGTASPPPGGPQPAKLIRVDFAPITGAFPGTES